MKDSQKSAEMNLKSHMLYVSKMRQQQQQINSTLNEFNIEIRDIVNDFELKFRKILTNDVEEK